MYNVTKYSTNLKDNLMDLGNPDDLRALLSLGLKYALEDRGRAIEQYSILTASQGHKYTPFISSEVNKALKLLMESGQAIGTLIPKGGNTFNILNQGPGNAPGTKDIEALTIDKAVLLIKDMGITPLVQNDAAKEALFISEGIGGTPEVCAIKQQGVDTSKEALNINDITKLQEIGHQDRRAEELEIDLDADEVG